MGSCIHPRDAGKTEEIVQELCLYFTLTRPDLTSVANLDGYLYTSLRHIYLSSLARSSREALHFVSIAEFESIDAALAGKPASAANYRKAAEAAMRVAKPQSQNKFKIELAKRCLTHALQMAATS